MRHATGRTLLRLFQNSHESRRAEHTSANAGRAPQFELGASGPAWLRSLAVNNLDDSPLMLLVLCPEHESAEQLSVSLQQRYDARLEDTEFGPRYKIGPAYLYRGQRFCRVCTFAGSLVIRMVFDARQGKFDRSVIYRFEPDQSFRLLSPGGPESEVSEDELVGANAP